jgi:hypothetical protein
MYSSFLQDHLFSFIADHDGAAIMTSFCGRCVGEADGAHFLMYRSLVGEIMDSSVNILDKK